MEGGDAAEHGGAEGAEMERDSTGEGMAQACDPPASLDWDFTAQYEASQRQHRQAGKEGSKNQTAVQGQKQISRQGEEDAGERDCRGGISEECQAWQEAALVAEGKMEVPRLRTGCRATQVPMEDEVQVVATAVGAEESRPTLGKRNKLSSGGVL